jgi:eukaryotic-like serine/threonine-protein kinase
MLSGRLEHMFSIFDAAVARPEREQAEFLADACRDDPQLRDEVESLLAAHREAEGFLSNRRRPPGEADLEDAQPSPPGLAPGTRLGVFAIESFLGAGGMGEVYRATDTRLDRLVAIKVLPSAAAGDPRARARFTGEARAIARLSHPRICALHDVGHHGSVDFLVMEYLEGETLAARLRRKVMSRQEAIRIAIEIAEALGAAHSSGIVHRDLKPANVMLTASGVKLLDFGLARLRAGAGSTPAGDASSRTGSGLIAGTVQYMAPEQLEARDVDARADIFSFGAVLYEMVTGHRAFESQRQASLISAILSSPHSSATVAPLALDRIIRTCLEKDRDARWANMHDVQLQLQWIAQEGSAPAVEERADLTRRNPGRWWRAVPWTIATVLAVGCVLMLGRWAPWKGTPTVAPQRLNVDLGVNGTLSTTDAPFVLSPDGTLLAFVARTDGGAPQLHIRHLDQFTATPLDGTEGASTPFFSPDAQWLAFFADSKLKKIPVTGGAAVTLAEAPGDRGGSWAEDGTIVFAPNNRSALLRVSSVGGPTQPVTTLEEGEITHRFPQILPGGAAVLYTASTEVNIGDDAKLVIQPLPSGERIIVQRGGYFGRYLASGHIVYMQDDTLFAMPFDPQRLEVTGPAGRTTAVVQSNMARGSAQLAVSQMGALAYLQGRNTFDARPIVWLDRTGSIAPLRDVPANWRNPEFSPDGRRIAMDIRHEGRSDIWVYDWTRSTLARVTSEGANEEFPVWTPDGQRIVYRTYRSSTDPSGDTLSWRRADGTGNAQVLVRGKAMLRPGSWHPGGKVLAYVATMPLSGIDVMTLPVTGDEIGGWKPGQPTAFVNSAAREQSPSFSPDGRWLAYSSNESGKDQVYVQPFSAPGARVMVSSGTGEAASWSRARPELVFSSEAADYMHVLMVARYRVLNGSFRVEKARLWAEHAPGLREMLGTRLYALHPDGVRVAIAPPSQSEKAAPTHLTFVLHFDEELRRIAPGKP